MFNEPSPSTRLSSSTTLALLEISEKCLHCNSEIEYINIFNLINQLVPFEKATSGLAKLDSIHVISTYELINISYPDDWLSLYNSKKFSTIDVVVQTNFTKFIPQYWDHTYKIHKPSQEFVKIAADFGIKHGYTFGSRPFGFCKQASLVSLSGSFQKYSPELIKIMQKISSHIHIAASYVLENRKKMHYNSLVSQRELEVLNWLKLGKSSWEISAILGVSESTVNFHAYRIMRKLDTVNRSQAVATAVHLGLIDLE